MPKVSKKQVSHTSHHVLPVTAVVVGGTPSYASAPYEHQVSQMITTSQQSFLHSQQPQSIPSSSSALYMSTSIPSSSAGMSGEGLPLFASTTTSRPQQEPHANTSETASNISPKSKKKSASQQTTSKASKKGEWTHPLLERFQTMVIPSERSKPLLCKECGRRYRNLTGIVHHYCITHASPEVIDAVTNFESDPDAKPFVCPECNRDYRNANGLAYHMETMHGLSDIIPKATHTSTSSTTSPKSEKTFCCPFENCGKVYKNKNGLSYHLENANHENSV